VNTDPERFDRVLSHPGYPATADRKIELPHGAALAVLGPGSLVVFGLLFLLIAINILLELEPPLAVTMLFVGLVLLFIVNAMAWTARGLQFYRTPIVRQVVVIVRDRAETDTYYVTLQTRDGTRAEYVTSPGLAGRLVIDDIGVGYVKGHVLLDFLRFDP
jgi:hypothetical protein